MSSDDYDIADLEAALAAAGGLPPLPPAVALAPATAAAAECPGGARKRAAASREDAPAERSHSSGSNCGLRPAARARRVAE